MNFQGKLNLTNLAGDILNRRLDNVTATDLVERLTDDLGIDHVMYFAVNVPGATPLRPIALGNYPKEWIDRYQERNYMLVDPVARHLNNGPCVWSSMTGLSDEEQSFMAESVPYLGHLGVTIPIGSPSSFAGISLTSRESDETWRERLPRIIWTGTLVGQRIHNIVLSEHKAIEHVTELTADQKMCLKFVAAGVDPERIAEMSKLSLKKVRRAIDGAQKRLQAHSPSHTVAKAALAGQIQF